MIRFQSFASSPSGEAIPSICLTESIPVSPTQLIAGVENSWGERSWNWKKKNWFRSPVGADYFQAFKSLSLDKQWPAIEEQWAVKGSQKKKLEFYGKIY